MTGESLSILVGSLLLEAGAVGLNEAVLAFAAFQVSCGVAWLAIVVPRERADKQGLETER